MTDKDDAAIDVAQWAIGPIPEAALRDAIDLANEELEIDMPRYSLRNSGHYATIRAHARTLMRLDPEKYAPVDPALVFARKYHECCSSTKERQLAWSIGDFDGKIDPMLTQIIREAIAFGEAQAKGAGK